MEYLKRWRRASLAVLALYCGLAALHAQSVVTLTPVASPSAAQPGVTTVTLIGSGFPSGTILPQDVVVTLTAVSSGPAPATFAASTVQPLFGSTESVTFTIPAGTFVVSSPTPCQVSIAGATTASVTFTSGNSASLTVNPAATVTVAPNTGNIGQSEQVTLTGLYTNFLQGSTLASFGPYIAVGGAALGQPGPVTVTSATTATAQLAIGNAAVSGPQMVQVATGIQVATSSFTINPPALAITTSSPLPTGTVGMNYSTTLMASGGSGIYTWAVSVGSLPAGLSLAAATGVISGQPTTVGTSNFTIQVTDTNSATASKQFSLTINPALAITTTSPLPTGTVGVNYSATLMATGGSGIYTWAVSVGSLPAGLSLAAATGVISGQPTTAGLAIFTIQVTDTNSATASKQFSLTINPGLVITTSSPLPTGTVGVNYSVTLMATGGSGIYTWAVSVGSLPAGLSLAAATGVISGQPTAAGTSNFTIQVTDTNSATATAPFALTINPALTISITPNSGNAGLSLQIAITGTNTNFVQGVTQASFGPGISVGGAADGGFGPVTVTDATDATAEIAISATAATGSQTVTVTTGAEQASLVNGFTILPAIASISLTTTSATPLAPGFSGFNDAYPLDGVEYWDPKWIAAVTPLKPGWLRFPGGTVSTGFDWETAHMNPAWLSALQPNMPSDLYNSLVLAEDLAQAKGGACFSGGGCVSDYATFIKTLGANGIVSFNGFSDTNPNSAGEMVAAAQAAGINIVEWEIANEPFVFPKIFPTPASYAAAAYNPYYLDINAADPSAIAGVFFQGQYIQLFGDYLTWDAGMAAYIPQYWQGVTYHVYPIDNSAMAVSDEEQTLNGILAHGTTDWYTSSIQPLIGQNTPVFLSEVNSDGFATMPFESYIYNGIFLAEFVARMSTVPQVQAVGISSLFLSNDFNQGMIRAVDDYQSYLVAEVQKNPNYSTDTSTNPNTQYQFYYSTDALAMEVANLAINNSNATWPTTVTGGPTVPIEGYDGNPVPAVFAQGYQGTDGTYYLLITNKSGSSIPMAIEVDGNVLQSTVTLSYISNASDTAQNTATAQDTVQIVTTTSANPITIGPYSVTRVEWTPPTSLAPQRIHRYPLPGRRR
jgi:hypothetical protein